ncbi:Nitrogenase molybdenum-iron protein beta chain [Caprobacter fermentans]|uniref:Nitrogenase molybdenum-iron protein beta chain n=1 Tax=Caproicibacter fermentans TaxID=2576756 RepID=A0A6N8HZG2_9FIRM|nr:nitrogenase component 1 [Caproicibacter fermentans]MVB11206.1 Nitrogenase molybdenum-iron protein beta chain [Caproicibacter fermentans]OCN00075.1 nitrogenase molybdenum-iron protein subunit beta [Clostridium sp. W14A]
MLNMTPKEMNERTALRINPCKVCQPVGAMYCALGVHGCMPHSHGSQGCCSYHRTYLSRHFKEPAIASSSSFTEGACVFGGNSNLKTAVKNIFDIYDPDIIAVHTTCLSETIGDDVKSYLQEMEIPEGKFIVHANTPSYVGSHVTGFSNMMSGFISYLAHSTGKSNGKAAIFPGFVNPGDMRELKRIAGLMRADCILFPDTSGVMDSPMTGSYEMYPRGGTKIEEIAALGDCDRVFALGELTSAQPAADLERKCKVPHTLLPYPMGIGATDSFVMALSRHIRGEVPYALEEERGQAIDLMMDAHPYYYGKSAAIYGDPDTVLGLTSLTLEMGMIPKYVITGTPGEAFVTKANALFTQFGTEGCTAKAAADLFELHQWIKNDPVDLLIGGSHGKYIARAEDIPIVRAGFPILDRYGHIYQPLVGYRGVMRLVEKIANAMMDRRDRDCADEDFEMVM